jgi:predicted SAM-dependent methyltransferase
MKCLNLGCGSRFHPEWVNLDLQPAEPSIQRWDLQEELPFPNCTFDVVYHSHVLEHFSKADGLRLLQRCHRVLQPNGILRIAVPDLEQIARLYLEALEKSLAGDSTWQARYEWIVLEMYDQVARESSGGEMLAYVRRDPIPERDFVASRIGGEFHRMTAPASKGAVQKPDVVASRLRNLVSRKTARLALGRQGMRAHDLGAFRIAGEVHRWMYDRYSLASALERASFESPRKVGPAESAIHGWSSFHLDTEPDGSVYKPDSLFMEATRA